MDNLYQMISEREPHQMVHVATLLEADSNYGRKAIFIDGILTASNDDALFGSLRDSICLSDQNQIIQTDFGPVFVEYLVSQAKVVIMGAGHVGLAMVKQMKALDFLVEVVDDREELLDLARTCGADTCIGGDFFEALNQLSSGPHVYYVIMTRGHLMDEAALLTLVKKPHAYLGMMGSRSRIKATKQNLVGSGLDLEAWGKIHSPIGLAIKAKTPAEIAVSVAAEIIEVKNAHFVEMGYTEDLVRARLDRPGPMGQVTVIHVEGSTPRGVGAKMLLTEDGQHFGTVGGGLSEKITSDKAFEVIRSGQGEIYVHDMTKQSAGTPDMICGGRMHFLIERI